MSCKLATDSEKFRSRSKPNGVAVGEVAEKKTGKEGGRTQNATMWRRPKFTASILGELHEMIQNALRSREDRSSMSAPCPFSLSLLSLSLSLSLLSRRCVTVYLSYSSSLIFHTLFLSSHRLLRDVVANWLLYKRMKTVFCVFDTFSHCEALTRISDFVWIYGKINYCRLFNVKSIFILINSSIWNNSVQHKYHFGIRTHLKQFYFKHFSWA